MLISCSFLCISGFKVVANAFSTSKIRAETSRSDENVCCSLKPDRMWFSKTFPFRHQFNRLL